MPVTKYCWRRFTTSEYCVKVNCWSCNCLWPLSYTKPNFALIFAHKFCKHVHLWRVKEAVNAVCKSRMMRLLYEPEIVVWAMMFDELPLLWIWCCDFEFNPRTLLGHPSAICKGWIYQLHEDPEGCVLIYIFWSCDLKLRNYHCITLKLEVEILRL